MVKWCIFFKVIYPHIKLQFVKLHFHTRILPTHIIFRSLFFSFLFFIIVASTKCTIRNIFPFVVLPLKIFWLLKSLVVYIVQSRSKKAHQKDKKVQHRRSAKLVKPEAVKYNYLYTNIVFDRYVVCILTASN